MAFLHCHSCHWSQDDFWNFRIGRNGYWKIPFIKLYWKYNPISCFLMYVFKKNGYWFPKRIKFDEYVIKERSWKRKDPHSWFLILYEFKRMIRKFKRQKWWIYKNWKKDYDAGKAKCPNCGKINFDID